MTPLHIAVEKGNKDIASLLITHPNINVNIGDINGIFFIFIYWAPLHFAIYENRIDIIKLFNLPETDINCKNSIGLTPLHFAVKKGLFNITSLLLDHPNIDVNCKDEKGIFYFLIFIGHHFISQLMMIKLILLNYS